VVGEGHLALFALLYYEKKGESNEEEASLLFIS